MKKSSFLKRNGLTLAMMLTGLIFLVCQFYTGWKELNSELQEDLYPSLSFSAYFVSGHFIESTFENLESEFLQMTIFVILTAFLFQKGSSESNPLPEENKDEAEYPLKRNSPKAMHKKGLVKIFYSYSLSIILAVLFFISFILHLLGSWKDYNFEESLKGKSAISLVNFIGHNKFWFESFQNWQSEFISIAAIVFLSIYFRQKGSSQSKPLNMPNSETKG